MVGYVSNELTPVPEDIIKGKSYINSNYICHCQYCGRALKNVQTLRIHYRTCTKRLLMRYYICNEFIFGLYCNPGKYLLSVEEEIKISADPKLVMGSIRVHMYTKKISGLLVMVINNEKNELYNNGRILYKDIKAKLNKEEILQLEKERSVVIQAQKEKMESVINEIVKNDDKPLTQPV